MMADELPDEIWLEILRYISLEDRIRNIQFCCKRFHRLCADYVLTHNLDFSQAVFLPEDLCLDAVNKANGHVSRLSFKGCHWLNPNLFMDLPYLPALETVNIVCCFLDVGQVLNLLHKVPKLKNLALTLSVEQMGQLRYIKENTPLGWPEIHIQRLHVHMYRATKVVTWHEYTADEYGTLGDYSNWMYNLFFPDRLAECFSVENNDKHIYYEFGKISRTVADFARYTVNEAFYVDVDCENFCRFTRKLGFHKPLLKEINVSPILDLSKLKYLRLSEFRPGAILNMRFECDGALVPHILPRLEYLRCSSRFIETCSYKCYDLLTKGILLDCQLPNLKYLDFVAWRKPPVEFYTRVSKMLNLVELNLSGPLDLNLLLECIQCLCRLENLIFIFEKKHDGRAFLEGLTLAAPRLRKLKVTLETEDTISNVFQPIQNLVFLESLGIYSNCNFGNVDAFCTVLKKLHRLTSVQFCVTKDKRYYFTNIIRKGLRFLPNLIQLTIRSNEAPTKNVLEAVKELKSLEKLWIDDLKMKNPIKSSTLFPLLEEAISSLPRLHLIAVCSNGFSESVKESAKEFSAWLQEEGRKIVLFCDTSCDNSVLYNIPEILRPLHPYPETWPALPFDCF